MVLFSLNEGYVNRSRWVSIFTKILNIKKKKPVVEGSNGRLLNYLMKKKKEEVISAYTNRAKYG